MAIMLKENEKIINDYIDKKLSKEYENYTRKVMSIQSDIKKNQNVEKNKATLKKIQDDAQKKWGDKKVQDYMLLAKKCMKFYKELEKKKEGMDYEDYEKLKKYTDVLGKKDMIDKVQKSMSNDVEIDTFSFITYAFREMSGVVNNWDKCHGNDLEKAFPMVTSDFEKGKYSEVGVNQLNLAKLKRQMNRMESVVEDLVDTKGKSHRNSKEFNKMIKNVRELNSKINELLGERKEVEYARNRDLSQQDSNQISELVQLAKQSIRKYIEAKGGVENQRTGFGKSRMSSVMEMYQEVLTTDNLCITKEVVEASNNVWDALSPKKAPNEKTVNAMVNY